MFGRQSHNLTPFTKEADMKVEIICLCCEGQDVKDGHSCPIGTMDGSVLKALCKGSKHRDFCTQCEKLLKSHFSKQLRKVKLRLEGE